MKKLLFVVLALFSLNVMAGVEAKDTGKNAKMDSHPQSKGSDYNKYPADPAFSYGIKAQFQRCSDIELNNCVVLGTYWLNGSTDVGKCNITPVAIANEINVYANLDHATKVLEKCEDLPQFVEIQYIYDPNHTGIPVTSNFFNWEFAVVRTDK